MCKKALNEETSSRGERGVATGLDCLRPNLRPKARHKRKNIFFFGGQASFINFDPERAA